MGRSCARGPAHVPGQAPAHRQHARVVCAQLSHRHRHGTLRTHGKPARSLARSLASHSFASIHPGTLKRERYQQIPTHDDHNLVQTFPSSKSDVFNELISTNLDYLYHHCKKESYQDMDDTLSFCGDKLFAMICTNNPSHVTTFWSKWAAPWHDKRSKIYFLALLCQPWPAGESNFRLDVLFFWFGASVELLLVLGEQGIFFKQY